MNAADSSQHPASQAAAADALHDAVLQPHWLPEERTSPEQVEICRRMALKQRWWRGLM